LHKGRPIGCVAFGAGSIGNASEATLLKDFRARLKKVGGAAPPPFDVDNFSMEAAAAALSAFLESECDQVQPPNPKPTLGILIGGYSSGQSLAEGWNVTIRGGKADKPSRLRAEGEVGINWGGEAEAVARLVLGFSPRLPLLLGTVIKTNQPEVISQIESTLRQKLQAPIVFPPMPIQDAIDLAEFLVHVNIVFSRFTPGAPTVGGPIEIAVMTKHEGFKWIKRKHYYDVQLNRESAHD
jgi:hypothetical protein